ncbi:MAG: hypothetical protein ACTSUE_17005 [Promethearchaeota archaeon]
MIPPKKNQNRVEDGQPCLRELNAISLQEREKKEKKKKEMMEKHVEQVQQRNHQLTNTSQVNIKA